MIAINSDILALNTNCDGRETVQPSAVHHVEQTVAASHGGIKGGLSTSSKEVEHVLDKVPPPLSLAQRMGLVEAPPTLLSNAEWAKVKSMSVHRHDSASPCPICHEPFGLAKQVIRITVFVSVNFLNNLNCTAQYNALLFQCAVLPVNAMTTLPVGTIIVLSCVSFELSEIPGAILSQQTLSNVQERELPKENHLRRSSLLQKLGRHCVSTYKFNGEVAFSIFLAHCSSSSCKYCKPSLAISINDSRIRH